MHPPAISFPDEFEKASTFNRGDTTALQRGYIDPGLRSHGPTLAYRLDDVLLFDGRVFARKAYEDILGRTRRLFAKGHIRNVGEALLCSTFQTETYFGHFIIDGLPLEKLAADRGVVPLVLDSEPWLHEAGYRDMVGLRPTACSMAHMETLWIVPDWPVTQSKLERLKWVRARVRAATREAGRESAAPAVFLKRGKLGARRNLLNEDQVIARLVRRGFDIVEPEALSALDISRRLHNARLVVGVEGSSFNHVDVAMAEKGAVVVIQSPHQFNAFGKVLADAFHQRYAYIVGEPRGSDFEINVDNLLKLIDMTEAELGKPRCGEAASRGVGGYAV